MQARVVWALIAAAVLAVAGCGDTEQQASTSKSVDSGPAKTNPVTGATTSEEAPARTREEPNPDGTSNLTCDYVLGDFNESGDPSKGFRFIGGGRIRNTGNIGIVVRVTFTWDMLGQEPLRVRKKYRLRRDQSRRVNVSVPGTQDQIDLHQSAHGDCRSHVTILDTFGKTPFE